ncbi:MAG: hypothetical protein MJ238_02640, partial [Bacilli bacterium]|nr:hypothetical protein [Bacilli bacterium]
HKAFFTVTDATTYTVRFEMADSTLSFDYSDDDFYFVDAAIYRADEYADVIYPDGGTSVDWKYEEGDYMMLAGMPVDGYVLENVKVNGAATEKVTQRNPWGQEETFFMYTFTSAGEYTVTYELVPAVDTTLTWNEETDHVDYIDVMVYTADEEADPLYAEEGSTIEWAYAEGDMAYIMAVAEDGYVVSSVKVNGEEATATTLGGADIGGAMTAYVYNFEEAGDYTITIETEVAINTYLSWNAETDHVDYMDVMVYTADPEADPLYAEEGSTIEWAYAEGDVAYIMAVAEDGYEVTSVKVNGVEATATTLGGADIGGAMTAYVYEFNADGEYTITVETALSKNIAVSWSEETTGVAYTEVMVYTADPEADPLYAEEGSTIEWVYAEGDMAYIMAVAEDGYLIKSVKVNGVAATATTLGGADIGGAMTAYVFEFTGEGEYNIVIEAIEKPFTEGGEAGPSDGTVENW